MLKSPLAAGRRRATKHLALKAEVAALGGIFNVSRIGSLRRYMRDY